MKLLCLFLLPAAIALLSGCASGPMTSTAGLTGAQEVPPVGTTAMGTVQITVESDGSVAGQVSTAGIDATAAHIHQAAAGVSGPVIVPLAKSSANTFTVPPGSKLTEAQYKAYQAGNLYVNVHSDTYPAGEIRAQLKPGSAVPSSQTPAPSSGGKTY